MPFGETPRGVRIVRRQVDRGARRREGADRGERRARFAFVRGHPVDQPREHGRLGVGSVARDEDRRLAVLDDHAQVVGGVAGRGDRDDRPVRGQPTRPGERPVRAILKRERLRIEALGPTLRQVSANLASEPRRGPQLARRGQHLAVGKARQAAVMVDVHVGENDLPHIFPADPERREFWRGLLLGLDREPDREAEVGMPARQAHQAGGRARVDEQDLVPMLHGVGKVGSQSAQSASTNGARRRPNPWPRPTT